MNYASAADYDIDENRTSRPEDQLAARNGGPTSGDVRRSHDKVVMTYHINPPQSTPPAGDDAWNAYVKQYRDNSDVKTTYITCMPKLLRK